MWQHAARDSPASLGGAFEGFNPADGRHLGRLERSVEIPGLLQVEPEIRGGAKEMREAKRRIRRDGAAAADDLVDALEREPMRVAKSTCVRPKGVRNSAARISPGWVGRDS